MQSTFTRFSVARFASQPFVGYSMVLQSVTRAVTRPMGRHLRRGCLVSKSGLRSSLAFFFLLLTSRIESSFDTDELDGCHFSYDRWAQDQTDCVSSFVNSPSQSTVLRSSTYHGFSRHCLWRNPFFPRRRVHPRGEV